MGRLRAAAFDALLARFERRHGRSLRRPTLAAAHGRVLEIGCGTGANLPHYPDAVRELVVTEPDTAMLERARARAGVLGRKVELVAATGERLPFPDASFDTVVSTLVLCSVADPARVLAEIRRVLVPGGALLFAEHVRSDDPGLARWQDRLEHPWRVIAHGCHTNRDTVALLDAAGFDVEIERRGAIPMAPPIVRPFVAGRATARATGGLSA